MVIEFSCCFEVELISLSYILSNDEWEITLIINCSCNKLVQGKIEYENIKKDQHAKDAAGCKL